MFLRMNTGAQADLPPRAVGIWLVLVCLAIAAMVAIGGVTRLTGSGLSITDWRPITGAVPPLNAADWQSEFEKYMGSPQHRLVFPDMTVEEFKGIYWWEWIHRFWGRMIGVVYAVPLAVFWLRGMVPGSWRWKLLLGLALGGAQGALGWFMVQSGLVDRPSVSAYRLAAHLGLAVLIFGLLWWWALRVLRAGRAVEPVPGWVRRGLLLLGVLLGVQIFYAGFVAGTKAAMAHPAFPGLGGSFFPSPASWLEPAWKNLFENTSWIAFLHRWLGVGLAGGGGLLAAWFAASGPRGLRPAALLLAALLAVQVGLGILTTVLSRGSIPVLPGTLHQANALALLALALLLLQATRASHLPRPPGPRKC